MFVVVVLFFYISDLMSTGERPFGEKGGMKVTDHSLV